MNLVLGALTADAASLGLHWIYDFKHLQKVAGTSPEFKTPDSKNYEGVFSFYAHGMKQAGDFSHYGETLLVYLKSQLNALAEIHPGTPNLRSYQTLYRDTFGPGGSFYGYIDNPTRLTLNNLNQQEAEAIEEAKKISKALPDEIAKVVVQKVLPYTRKYSGEDLKVPIARAIQVTYSQPEILETALVIAKAIDQKKKLRSGADDQQCPAWSTLSALCTFSSHMEEKKFLANLEEVVRVTNNSDAAVVHVQFAASFLRSLQKEKSLEKAFLQASSQAPLELQNHVKKVWNKKYSSLEVASGEIGRTCYLREALPLCLYILQNTSNFKEALRMNILAGGDSCGRAMFLGAAAVALYGVDDTHGLDATWLLRIRRGTEIAELVSTGGL